MLIESKLRREKETPITMKSGKTYVFAPRPGDDRHVCEVEHDDDASDFLAIKEGYRIAKNHETEPPASQPTPASTVSPFTPQPTSAPSAAPVPLVSDSTIPPAPASTEAPVSPLVTTSPVNPIAPGSVDLDAMSKAELIDHAKSKGIAVNESLPKPAILSTVKAASDGR